MHRKLIPFLPLLFFILFSSFSHAAEIPRISVDDLNGVLGTSEVVVVDVRRGGDWRNSETKITGAVRVDPRAVNAWGEEADKKKTIVLYCA